MEIARLITLEEAAQRLGIQPRTLIRYVRSGKIKAKLFRFETMTLIEVRATQDTNGSAARGIEISRMEAGGMNDKKGISQVEAAKKCGPGGGARRGGGRALSPPGGDSQHTQGRARWASTSWAT